MVCAQPFDSFDESALGAFMESPLGVRAGSGGGFVLVWDETDYAEFGTSAFPDRYAFLQTVNYLIATGVTVHRIGTFSGVLAEYDLIFLISPQVIPEWWSQINHWIGRLVFHADFSQSSSSRQELYDTIFLATSIFVSASLFYSVTGAGSIRFPTSHPLSAGWLDTTGFPQSGSGMRRMSGGLTVGVWAWNNSSRIVMHEETVSSTKANRISFVAGGFELFRGAGPSLSLAPPGEFKTGAADMGRSLYEVPV